MCEDFAVPSQQCPHRPQSGYAWACPSCLHGQHLGKSSPLVGTWNIGLRCGMGLPKSCPCRTVWALIGQAQVLPMCLCMPTFLLGHDQLGLPNHVFGHTPAVKSPINCLSMPNLAHQCRKVGKPKYVGCIWACPPSAQVQPKFSPCRCWHGYMLWGWISPISNKECVRWQANLAKELPQMIGC